VIDKLKFWWVLKKGKRDSFHQYLKSKEATLYITKPDYAYLEVGNMRYYFHSSDSRVIRYREVYTPNGKFKQSIVPYDGWERHFSDDTERIGENEADREII